MRVHEPHTCTISYKSLTVLHMHSCAHLRPVITSTASGCGVSAVDIKCNLCVFSALSSVHALLSLYLSLCVLLT